MEAITGWAASLCIAAIACAALQMLAPKKANGKLFKMITVAFFLCCMIAPLLSLKSILPLRLQIMSDSLSADVLEERVQKQFQEQVTAALWEVTEQTLENYKIKPLKVEVDMDTDEDGRIYITNVVITLDKQSQVYLLTAKQVMEQRLGVEVTVKTAAN